MRQVTAAEIAKAVVGLAAVLGVYCAARLVGGVIALGVRGVKAAREVLTMPIEWKDGDR